MSTITAPTIAPAVDTTTSATSATSVTSASAGPKALWRVGARAGVVAAVAVSVVAGVALAAGVPLEVEGEAIPVAAFAQMTLLGTAAGVLLAKALQRWSARASQRFVAATVALTALSIVPDFTTAGISTASRLVLAATHVVAAAIVVPAIARRLRQQG